MFFKIGVFKNSAIFTKKHLCWSLSLIKLHFYWKRSPCTNTGIFLWILRNYWEKFIILLWNFYVMIEFFRRLWVQNWYFSYFLCHCFVFFHNSSARIGSPWWFCTCIYTKSFSKYNFRMHYNLAIRNLKIVLPKNKLMQKFRQHWSIGQRENSRFIAANCKDRFKL